MTFSYNQIRLLNVGRNSPDGMLCPSMVSLSGDRYAIDPDACGFATLLSRCFPGVSIVILLLLFVVTSNLWGDNRRCINNIALKLLPTYLSAHW